MQKQESARAWERFAREDAEFYVLSRKDLDFGTPEGQEAFFESGRADAAAILDEAAPWLGERRVALEIGCGIGRLTLPMARRFGRVRAMDLSPTMLVRLEENGRRAGVANVDRFLAHEPWEAQGPVDFVWSRWVLQHVPQAEVIEEYVRRVSLCLAPEGVAHLQFDTRPATLAYHLRNAAPDALLPREWRRNVRRIRRSAGWLRETFARHGLRPVRELREDTEEHTFLLRRA